VKKGAAEGRTFGEWWFGYGSPTAMGVFRMLVGFGMFLNLAMVGLAFQDWFTEKGFVPIRLLDIYQPPISPSFLIGKAQFTLPFVPPRIALLAHCTDERVTAAFYLLTMVAALFTMLGLWSRVSTIALAIGVVSLHMRNPLILHGGDTVMRISVLYVALAPSGAACSLDRLIAMWRGKAPKAVPLVSMWPQRLVAYNMALVYLTTVWGKWDGSKWHDGTATWYTARLAEFFRFPVPSFVNQLPFVHFTTYATLATEFALGTLVFYKPFRKWALLAGLCMHGWIEYSMNIPIFGLVMCSMYISFYDGEEVTEWAHRLGERLARFRIRVMAPAGAALQPGPRAALEGMDALGLVSYEAGTEEEWSAEGSDGSVRNPFLGSLTRSMGAWPLLLVPWVWHRLLAASVQPALQGRAVPARASGS